MRFVLLLMCGLLLVSSCKKDKIKVEDDLPYLNFSFSTSNESLMKGVPRNDMSKYGSVLVLMYSYNDTETYNPKSLPSTLPSYGKVKLSNADGTGTIWNYAPPKFWPTNRKLAFFAYSSDLSLEDGGITISDYQSGIPTITYSVPTDVKKQPDLLVSTPVVDMTKESNNGSNKIKLTMNHALSCISFAPVSTLSRQIESITIKGVYSIADLKFKDIQTVVTKSPNIEWTGHRGDKSITFFAGIKGGVNIPQQLPTDLAYLMSPDGYLMMVPQKIEPGAKIVVKYNDRDDEVELDIPEIEWKSGKKYIYSWGSGGVVTYYEIYADGNVGFYYYDIDGTPINSIRNLPDVDNAGIVEAGYGVLSYGPVAVKLKWGDSEIDGVNAMFGVNAKVGENDFYLYPVSQTAITGGNKGPFTLVKTNTPQKIYINGESTHGYCLPHFAKGIYMDATVVKEHYIRTPQQMINISENTYQDDENIGSNFTYGCKFKQEHHLSFSSLNVNIGGKDQYTKSIVGIIKGDNKYGNFEGEYNGNNKSIKSMKLNSSDNQLGLFMRVGTTSVIKDLTIENSCSINGDGSYVEIGSGVGAFAGRCSGKLSNLVNRANVITWWRRNVGGVCGYIDFPPYGMIEKCHNYGNVQGAFSIGGIVGAADAFWQNNTSLYLNIRECTTNGGIITSVGSGDWLPNGAGGICGYAPVYGTSIHIERCINYGTNIVATSSAGGILGMASIGVAKTDTGTFTGGKIEFGSCAVYNATVSSSGSGFGVGGVVGTSTINIGEEVTGTILLENMLYVSNSSTCPITSTLASGGVNPQTVYVGGIIGDAAKGNENAKTTVGNSVYIGIEPIGVFNGINYSYTVVGNDSDANFTGKYYTLKGTNYNTTPSRYGRSVGLTTNEYISNPPIGAGKLDSGVWESSSTEYPYPKLKGVAIPAGTGWWPVANGAKRALK